jgi:hypothetical protein
MLNIDGNMIMKSEQEVFMKIQHGHSSGGNEENTKSLGAHSEESHSATEHRQACIRAAVLRYYRYKILFGNKVLKKLRSITL